MRSRPTAPIASLVALPGRSLALGLHVGLGRVLGLGRTLRLSLVLALGLGLGLGLVSCRAESPIDPLQREPALLFEGPALLRFLERASTLADTPAGRATAKLRSRLEGCREVAFSLPKPATPPSAPVPALEALACREASGLTPALAAHLERARGAHAGVLQWPIGERGRLELRFDVDAAGGLALVGRLEADEAMGALAFLLPAAEPPAPARIDAARTLVHLHLRSASGTGLAALVPKDGQADRLFALKGRLLEGALLEGTLELAFVEPVPDGQVPLAVLAVHHRGAAPIEAALAEALGQLESTWSIVPAPRRFGGANGLALDGGCYADLPLLPELAPCWVVTPDALLVGYRAEAIEAVLAESAKPSEASGLVVDLERVRSLDRRLVAAQTEVAGAGPWPARVADLYSRLELRGATAEDGAIELSGRLEARP
ncbi:MAG: hypothetical protein IPK00_09715 [Deltaproteobacteria bacterium]|nr:hypothetical protein [Deltaproteobacteria bacterium]